VTLDAELHRIMAAPMDWKRRRQSGKVSFPFLSVQLTALDKCPANRLRPLTLLRSSLSLTVTLQMTLPWTVKEVWATSWDLSVGYHSNTEPSGCLLPNVDMSQDMFVGWEPRKLVRMGMGNIMGRTFSPTHYTTHPCDPS
jgi:hypothetical protein